MNIEGLGGVDRTSQAVSRNDWKGKGRARDDGVGVGQSHLGKVFSYTSFLLVPTDSLDDFIFTSRPFNLLKNR